MWNSSFHFYWINLCPSQDTVTDLWSEDVHACVSFQDEVNQIMETNLWLRHVSDCIAFLIHFALIWWNVCYLVSYIYRISACFVTRILKVWIRISSINQSHIWKSNFFILISKKLHLPSFLCSPLSSNYMIIGLSGKSSWMCPLKSD